MAVNPTGPGLSLLVITIILLIFSWLTVIARVLVRRRIKAFGLDDWLMCIGLICFSVTCAFIITSIYNGAGTRADNLNDYYQMQGRKWYTFAQIIYCLTTIPIKCSICVALLRIATKRIFRWIIHSIMVITVLSSLAIDTVILSWCRPIAAAWGGAPGVCGPATTNANVGYFYSAVCILTDWALAILPALMLHDVQLKRRVKVSVAFVLALGAFASTATIVRLRYLVLYNDPVEYLWGVAQIAVWSMIEEGTGIIAGSLAALRPLLRHLPFLSSSSRGGSYGASSFNRRVGRRGSNKHGGLKMGTFQSSSAACGAGREDRSDGDSQRHILKETEVVVTSDDGRGGKRSIEFYIR